MKNLLAFTTEKPQRRLNSNDKSFNSKQIPFLGIALSICSQKYRKSKLTEIRKLQGWLRKVLARLSFPHECKRIFSKNWPAKTLIKIEDSNEIKI
jgi:hypothetical protein